MMWGFPKIGGTHSGSPESKETSTLASITGVFSCKETAYSDFILKHPLKATSRNPSPSTVNSQDQDAMVGQIVLMFGMAVAYVA